MYRQFYFLFLFLLVGCAGEEASDLDSFDFSIDVPSNWIVLSNQKIKENPGLFNGLSIEGVSPEMMRDFRRKVESGSTQFYFRQDDNIASFADNVNVIKSAQVLPKTPDDLNKIRDALPGEFEKAFGKPIKLHECRFAKIANRNAIFIEFDGVLTNTRSMQYQIAKSNRVSLTFTATCQEATLEDVRREFELMIKSIRF